jgi:hypothetical protein
VFDVSRVLVVVSVHSHDEVAQKNFFIISQHVRDELVQLPDVLSGPVVHVVVNLDFGTVTADKELVVRDRRGR